MMVANAFAAGTLIWSSLELKHSKILLVTNWMVAGGNAISSMNEAMAEQALAFRMGEPEMSNGNMVSTNRFTTCSS